MADDCFLAISVLISAARLKVVAVMYQVRTPKVRIIFTSDLGTRQVILRNPADTN